ncbi:hypothetical protein B0H19DRAFT_1090194 [Mycena capillaripes]|nr:hypothetical protein B0H19DRAFT_1090194 [Mycena capillaripes]
MYMKKGFLNSSKAKAKLTKDTDSSSIAAFSRPTKLEVIERHYGDLGIAQNAGRPEGYEVEKRVMKELDALAPPENLDKNTLLYTTQPSVNMDTTPADFPDGWTECFLDADVKGLILATPGFPAPLLHPYSRKYRLAPSSDKGHGLFSIGKIQAGDLILSERPLTLTPTCFGSSVRFVKELTAQEKYRAALYEWEQQLKFLFDRLHPDYQAAFMALANSHKHDGSGPIGGVIRTNGLGVECLQTGRYSVEEQQKLRRGVYNAVCKEISRLNHSCSPNTTARFDVATFSYQLFAARDIAKGEELTLSYTGLNLPAMLRQKSLEPYGFQCTCSACLTPFESDAQRAMCLSMQITNIDDGLRRVALFEEQGLQVCDEYCGTLKAVIDLFIGTGDADTASTYAKKLAKRQWSKYADEAKLYTTPRAIQSHPLWMKKNGGLDADKLGNSFARLDLEC